MGEVFYDDAALGIEGWVGRAEVQLARDGKISVTKYDLAGRTAESYTLAIKLGTVPSEAGGLSPNFSARTTGTVPLFCSDGQIFLNGSATEYNTKGQAWKSYRLTGVDGVVEKTLLSTSTYDANGRLASSKNELTGAQTLYGYDDIGRQIWTGTQMATETPEYVYSANEYEDTYGRLVRVNYGLSSEPSGEYLDGDPGTPSLASLSAGETYVRYIYDSLGRKIEDVKPNDNGGEGEKGLCPLFPPFPILRAYIYRAPGILAPGKQS